MSRTNFGTTLVITTYDWPAALALSLKSVARQSVMPSEVIVADDGSGPETAAVVADFQERLPVPLRHLWEEHRGFRLARSRNRAIAAARGDYLILIDGDIVIHEHFVADHVRAARPDTFVQGGRLATTAATAARMLAGGEIDLGFFSRGIRHRSHAIRNRALSRLLFFERRTERAIRGCHQAFWRDNLLTVNGFNEQMVGWGHEDHELLLRLYHAGFARRDLKFQALAIHLHHPSRQPSGPNPNLAVLRETMEKRLAWCEQGLNQHLEGRAGCPPIRRDEGDGGRVPKQRR